MPQVQITVLGSATLGTAKHMTVAIDPWLQNRLPLLDSPGGSSVLDAHQADIIANLLERIGPILRELSDLDEETRVAAINAIRAAIHRHSPFAAEPVDCVQWIRAEIVRANDYNPNTVAPPEMALLEHSIAEDGYTQPIVAWQDDDGYEVVDGFHRNRVGRESPIVRERVRGYLPLAIVNTDRLDRGDRIAATIRHNRARGKHRIDAMSEIVMELTRRNWSSEKIGKELGMEPDEVLRLAQITGLAEMFADRDFSEAWEATAFSDMDEVEIDEAEPELDQSDIPGPEGWDHRTDKLSVMRSSDGRVLGKIVRSPHSDQWRWIVYGPPMQTGRVESRAEALTEVETWLSLSNE